MSVEFVQIDWSDPSAVLVPACYCLIVATSAFSAVSSWMKRHRAARYRRLALGYACLGLGIGVTGLHEIIVLPDQGWANIPVVVVAVIVAFVGCRQINIAWRLRDYRRVGF